MSEPYSEQELAEIRENLKRWGKATPGLNWPDATIRGLLATLDAERRKREEALRALRIANGCTNHLCSYCAREVRAAISRLESAPGETATRRDP